MPSKLGSAPKSHSRASVTSVHCLPRRHVEVDGLRPDEARAVTRRQRARPGPQIPSTLQVELPFARRSRDLSEQCRLVLVLARRLIGRAGRVHRPAHEEPVEVQAQVDDRHRLRPADVQLLRDHDPPPHRSIDREPDRGTAVAPGDDGDPGRPDAAPVDHPPDELRALGAGRGAQAENSYAPLTLFQARAACQHDLNWSEPFVSWAHSCGRARRRRIGRDEEVGLRRGRACSSARPSRSGSPTPRETDGTPSSRPSPGSGRSPTPTSRGPAGGRPTAATPTPGNDAALALQVDRPAAPPCRRGDVP